MQENLLMRLAENESRRVGMKFEALVELSQEWSDVGFEIRWNGIGFQNLLWDYNNIFDFKDKRWI